MTLEELKVQWNQLSVRVDRLEEENRRLASELATGRATSAQQRLASHYTKHALIGLLLPLLAPMLVFVLDMPLWVAVLYGLLGLLCMAADLIFARYIRRSNFAILPVVNSLENMLKAKKYQRRMQIVFIIIGGIFLGGAFFPALEDEPSVMIGALIGLIIGICCGLTLYFKKVRLINEILKELKESVNPSGGINAEG